ncbi:MAG: hypothetical protein Q9190_005339 [Brigantiaea leucoxantha]
MSRKPYDTTKSPPIMPQKHSLLDSTAAADQSLHSPYDSNSSHKQSAKHSIMTKSKTQNSIQSAESHDGSDEEADGEDTNAADADDENNDDEDPDAPAPSDHSGHSTRGQTGLFAANEKHVKAKVLRKRKRSVSPTASHFPERQSKTAKVLSTTNHNTDSDDEVYHGVDDISDSEEEPEIQRLEENLIINSEEDENEQYRARILSRSPPWASTDSEGWGHLDDSQGLFLGDVPFFDEEIDRTQLSLLSGEMDVFGTSNVLDFEPGSASKVTEPSRRRVRFADDHVMVPSEPASIQPGTSSHIMGKNHPIEDQEVDSYRHIECDVREIQDNKSSSKRKDPWPQSELAEESASDDDTGTYVSSSGYETDLGETTDEEDIPASATTRPQALLRRTSAECRSVTQTPGRRAAETAPNYRWGPTLGSWIADPTKPIAVVDSSGTKINIYPAQRPIKNDGKVFPTLSSSSQSSANTSPRNSVAQVVSGQRFDVARVGAGLSNEAGLASASNLNDVPIMSNFFHGDFDGQILGPPEAFHPFQSINADGSIATSPLQMGDDNVGDSDSGEDVLNIEDFLDFSDEFDEPDHNEVSANSAHSSWLAPQMDTEASSSVKTYGDLAASETASQTLLDHFDKGVVTAFRRNQHQYNAQAQRPSSLFSFGSRNNLDGKKHIITKPSLGHDLRKRTLSGNLGIGRVSNSPSVMQSLLS